MTALEALDLMNRASRYAFHRKDAEVTALVEALNTDILAQMAADAFAEAPGFPDKEPDTLPDAASDTIIPTGDT